MSQTRWNFEIIVVVDGFVDKTFDNAKKIKKDKIKVVGYENNKGKGYAIRYGMARSKGDLICFIDSGMDIDASGISMLLEHMVWYDADIVVGSKRHPVSQVYYPLVRKLYSFGYHFLVRLLFSLNLKDTQTGLKVFKRGVLEKVLPRLLVKRFAIDIEMLAVSKYLGFDKIYEAPVKVQLDPNNSEIKNTLLIFSKNVRNMMQDTLAVFYRLKILGYYDDGNKRKWVYDKDLDMKINTGEI
jgi:glycosyltransferase involved in cell wall biosynthesis